MQPLVVATDDQGDAAYMDGNHGFGSNVPWGFAMSPIPHLSADEEAAAVSHFQLVLKTFKQLEAEAEAEPALRLVAVAGCG